MLPIEDCSLNGSNCPRKASPDGLFDVLIIGGGAVGCSIARELSKYCLSIGLVEKSDDVSQGASKSNSGIVHGGYDEKHGTLKASLACKGNQLFAGLEKDLHFGFKVIGSLVLAFSSEDIVVLEKLLVNGKLNGVPNLVLLNREQVLVKEPRVNPEVIGALYCPDAGITSPYEYTIALAENAIQNGVQFYMNQEVVDIQRTHDDTFYADQHQIHTPTPQNPYHFLIRTGHDGITYRSKIVINAAGLMSDRVAAMVGANDFYITPRKGEYLLLHRSQGSLAKHVLFPVPSVKRGKGILVSPTYHGNLLLGPTSRGSEEANMTQRDVIQFIIQQSRHSVPDFDLSHVITSYSGLRAKCSRGDFIVEESKSVPGFINVAGIDSPGLTSSPAIAKLVVELVSRPLLDKHVVLKSKPSFHPNRKAIIIPKGDDFDGSIDDSDPTKNIICRCERVTESEILDSISRPLGARGTDAVKRRTRAGMGYCQGNFCEPRVVSLLSRQLNVPPESIPRRSAGSSLLPHRRLTDQDRQLLNELAKL